MEQEPTRRPCRMVNFGCLVLLLACATVPLAYAYGLIARALG